MCGISGIVHLDMSPIQFEYLKSMSESIKHRGPDDQGYVGFSFANHNVKEINVEENNPQLPFHGGIGFNRLSILDLSMNGHQPMISENQKIVIAYNGETYNAFDFKEYLVAKGFRFKSNTDTEILLYLYQHYGIVKMLELLNGMFAFCIVDLELNKIFLVRDHVGIKPMYWFKKNNTLLFASEIKAFLQHPEFDAQINEQHIDEYQLYNYSAHDRTLFTRVSKIPPGHFMEISMKGEKLCKYYEPSFKEDLEISKKNAQENLEQTLKHAIKSQLISDVKVGCQLSGGIDSSLITTFARKYFRSDMDTFSVILENMEYSEEKYISMVVEKTFATSHKFKLTPKDFAENLIATAWHYDEPLLIPQAVGIKQLAKNASKHITVLLSGEGSDELMGGYRRYYNLCYKKQHQGIIHIMSKIPGKGQTASKRYLPGISTKDFFLRQGGPSSLDRYSDFRPDINLNKTFQQREELFPENTDLLKQVRYYEMRAWLGATLMIQDKMTMAHSIENRVPFTDKKIVEFVFSLPSKYFVKSNINPLSYNNHNKNTKILLKKVTEKYYPNEFVYRRKMGFNQPLHDYFADPLLQELIQDSLLPGIKQRGIVNYIEILNLWDRYQKTKSLAGLMVLWNWFSFELWAQLFIDKKIVG